MAKTRYEKIKEMSIEDLGTFLCQFLDEFEKDNICDECPARNYCSLGHNGMKTYLNEEVDT